jgi:hypothetical protein
MTDQPKIRVDLAEMTLRELGDVGRLLAPRTLAEVMQSPEQTDAIAALACVVKRRTDPDYSLEQALDLRMGDIDMVSEADPLANSNGAQPLALLASGDSTLQQ